MSTVEQTRDSLHPSSAKEFEDAVFSVIDQWSIPVARRLPGPRNTAAMRARREMSDLAWDMDIEEFLDVIDPDLSDQLADLVHCYDRNRRCAG